MIFSAEMRGTYLFRLLPVLFILTAGGCSEPAAEIEIPEHIAAMDSLTVLDPDTSSVEKLELVRDVAFGSTDDLPIGAIVEFDVDERGRVFIAEGRPGSGVIHVYYPDGSHLTTIGQYGRGPGDLLNTVEMEIRNNRLFNFNGVNAGTQVSIFSLRDFSFLESFPIRRDGMEKYDHLVGLGPDYMYVRDEQLLMGFRSFMLQAPEKGEHHFRPYHYLSMEGRLNSGKIIELRGPDRYYPSQPKFMGASGYALPFSRRSLLAVANDGTIYTTWTEDFLIEVRDKMGVYRRAIYWPREKSPLSLSEFDFDQSEINEIEEQLPTETWPALHTMLVDEKNRLWIAAFADDGLGGMIISDEGNLLATFDWPGERMDPPRFTERKMVKAGYFYTRERDEETGLSSVVRYELRKASGERYE